MRGSFICRGSLHFQSFVIFFLGVHKEKVEFNNGRRCPIPYGTRGWHTSLSQQVIHLWRGKHCESLVNPHRSITASLFSAVCISIMIYRICLQFLFTAFFACWSFFCRSAAGSSSLEQTLPPEENTANRLVEQIQELIEFLANRWGMAVLWEPLSSNI